tara:strand:- start:538 stop:780 length:243 start_codon:yes stop_codon:yes gene_type:complete
MRGYYSVFNPRGEKIADCGNERDAVNLMSMRNCRWEGHYFTFVPLPGDIIDITRQLPYNMEVDFEYIESLPENTQDPLNL